MILLLLLFDGYYFNKPVFYFYLHFNKYFNNISRYSDIHAGPLKIIIRCVSQEFNSKYLV